MVRRLLLLSILSVAAIAAMPSNAMAGLNITLKKLDVAGTSAELTFSQVGSDLFGDIDQFVGFSFAGLAGTSSGTISPGFTLFAANPGFASSTYTGLSVAGNTLVLNGSSELDGFSFYGASTGTFDLAGVGFNTLANGTYSTSTGAAASFGQVNLTVTGVPEPASMIYGSLLACSAGIGYVRRRRNSKAEPTVA